MLNVLQISTPYRIGYEMSVYIDFPVFIHYIIWRHADTKIKLSPCL